MQHTHFNIWKVENHVAFSVIQLSAETGINMYSGGDAYVPIHYHGHAYISRAVLCAHTSTLGLTIAQPEAEDLRLRSGTWSQSHLGREILLCSPQSGLILCSTESSCASSVSLSTYKCAAEFMWLTSVSFSRTKRFLKAGRHHCGECLWREGERTCNPSNVELNPAWETKEEERRRKGSLCFL